MVDKIRIRNLRSLKDTGEVELKPLTLLVGKNSSGKSTFLRVFPLFKQTLETNTNEPILWYSSRYVDFGSFNESLNKLAKKKILMINSLASILNLVCLKTLLIERQD